MCAVRSASSLSPILYPSTPKKEPAAVLRFALITALFMSHIQAQSDEDMTAVLESHFWADDVAKNMCSIRTNSVCPDNLAEHMLQNLGNISRETECLWLSVTEASIWTHLKWQSQALYERTLAQKKECRIEKALPKESLEKEEVKFIQDYYNSHVESMRVDQRFQKQWRQHHCFLDKESWSKECQRAQQVVLADTVAIYADFDPCAKLHTRKEWLDQPLPRFMKQVYKAQEKRPHCDRRISKATDSRFGSGHS